MRRRPRRAPDTPLSLWVPSPRPRRILIGQQFHRSRLRICHRYRPPVYRWHCIICNGHREKGIQLGSRRFRRDRPACAHELLARPASSTLPFQSLCFAPVACPAHLICGLSQPRPKTKGTRGKVLPPPMVCGCQCHHLELVMVREQQLGRRLVHLEDCSSERSAGAALSVPRCVGDDTPCAATEASPLALSIVIGVDRAGWWSGPNAAMSCSDPNRLRRNVRTQRIGRGG